MSNRRLAVRVCKSIQSQEASDRSFGTQEAE